MITLSNIYLKLGGRPVLNNLNLQINDSECIAVVGPNGCGKSTLLRLLVGIEKAETGSMALPSRATLGYLPQEADLDATHSLQEELLRAFGPIQRALEEMANLQHDMGTVDAESPEYRAMMERYSELSHHVEHQDGYSLEAQVGRVTTGLGFSKEDLSRSCSEFSGGWKMRILLAKVLLEDPDILLLDEPTNHLDLESMLWLEDWIRNCKQTVVMVSHERAFMDRLVDRIVCLEFGFAEVYTGNYSEYIVRSEARRRQHQEAYERQRKEIEQMEAFIRRFRYNAARASQVQSRVKQMDKIERLSPPFYGTAIYFKFPEASPSYREVVTMENLGKSYGQHAVFSGLNAVIYRGDKVGLVGVNGAGKTTLLRIIAGCEPPTEGTCDLGKRAQMSHFAQYDTDTLSSKVSLLEAVKSSAPVGQEERVRDLLGAFLFSGDDVDKPLTALSGGERTRFRLAQMLFSPANLLLLDEPTNHLDVTSRATVERALRDYEGTVIVVSHDRVFMENVTNKILELENGTLRFYPGTYREYLEDKQRRMALQERQEKENPKARISKKTKQQDWEQRKAYSRKRRSLERQIEQIEQTLEQQEQHIKHLESQLIDPKIASDYTQLTPLSEEHQNLNKSHHQLLEKWDTLHDELSQLEKNRP